MKCFPCAIEVKFCSSYGPVAERGADSFRAGNAPAPRRGIRAQGQLIVAVADVLEARLVHDGRLIDLGVGDLHRILVLLEL